MKSKLKIAAGVIVSASVVFALVYAQGKPLEVAVLGGVLAGAVAWALFTIVYLGGGGS